MPWENNGGGGPWGGGGGNRGNGGGRGPGGGQGGGGGPQSPWGRGGGPGGPGRQQPDVEELVRRGQDKLKSMMPGNFGSGTVLGLVLGVVVVFWLATGFYQVEPDEQGVELVFGKLFETTNEGLHYNFPAPIGEVLKPKVTSVNRVEIGFRESPSGSTTTRQEESLMLTGDENIIDYQFVVFWVIDDAGKYLFNIRNPDETVKHAAESAMREIIGQTNFEYARTNGRADVALQAQELVQQILDRYGSGILVQQVELQKVDPPSTVLDAFRDVQAARADKERAINEATAYFNQVTNKAQGQAEQILRSAEAYKEEQIAQSKGESSRFLAIYNEYLSAKDVTKRRIYLQTMEEILRNMDKILIDNSGESSGVLPYLPLNELNKSDGTRRNLTSGRENLNEQ